MRAKLEVCLKPDGTEIRCFWRIHLSLPDGEGEEALLQGRSMHPNVQSAYASGQSYVEALALRTDSAWLLNADDSPVGYWAPDTGKFHSVCDRTVEMPAIARDEPEAD